MTNHKRRRKLLIRVTNGPKENDEATSCINRWSHHWPNQNFSRGYGKVAKIVVLAFQVSNSKGTLYRFYCNNSVKSVYRMEYLNV